MNDSIAAESCIRTNREHSGHRMADRKTVSGERPLLSDNARQ